MSAAEGASEASSPEQASGASERYKCAVQANERTDEGVAQYLRLYSYLFQTTVEWLNDDSITY